MSKTLTADLVKQIQEKHKLSTAFVNELLVDVVFIANEVHKAKVESEIIPLIKNEEFGRGAFNRDEYQSRILEKLQKLLEQ